MPYPQSCSQALKSPEVSAWKGSIAAEQALALEDCALSYR